MQKQPKFKSSNIQGPFSVPIGSQRSRKAQSVIGIEAARQAIGKLRPGTQITGITKGAFSMIDFIEAVVEVIGQCEIDVSTWTLGVYDADVLWQFTQIEKISKIRFLLDPSMFGRKEELAESFLAAFGSENIRALDNHAKFTLLKSDKFSVTITSSMNLNRNSRLENFVLMEDPSVWKFYRKIVDDIFDQTKSPFIGQKRSGQELRNILFSGEKTAKAGPVIWGA